MSSAEFGALLVLATAASFTPGPNTTLSTAIAANRGLRGALRFVCAVPAGWGLMLVLALPPLRWGVLAAGVGYMLWLAGRLAPAFVETVTEAQWQGRRLVVAHDPVRAQEQTALRADRIAALQARANQLAGKLDGRGSR